MVSWRFVVWHITLDNMGRNCYRRAVIRVDYAVKKMAVNRYKYSDVLEGRLLKEGVTRNAKKLFFYYYMSCDF